MTTQTAVWKGFELVDRQSVLIDGGGNRDDIDPDLTAALLAYMDVGTPLASMNGADPVTGATGSFVVPAVNTTVVDTSWMPFGPVQAWGTAAATPGNSLYAPVDGMLVCPPGHSVCVTVAGSLATASTFQCGLVFLHEALTTE